MYLSRKLRFDDVFFTQYDKHFNLDHDKDMNILEIGCGPGALTESLHRWYPNAIITAIDRDSNFIKFAQENITGNNDYSWCKIIKLLYFFNFTVLIST